MNEVFGTLWLQAELECHTRLDKFAGFDFGDNTEDMVRQRFGELIVEHCLAHVDTWTGTKYTPATDRIIFNIKQEFNP
jgi:hypothetical protein